MKIRTKKRTHEQVLSIPRPAHKKPMKQRLFWRILLRLLSIPELLAVRFSVKRVGMEKLSRREPCLVLMNHNCFLDLEIASTLLFPRPFNVVCTTDGFVGKNLLMRMLGCIPTKKFIADTTLVRDMTYVLRDLKSSVLLFPEAGYSLDGTATVLPESLGGCIKRLGVPVVMIETRGAFFRQPLHNELKKRRVKIEAEMRYLFSAEETASLSTEEINARLSQEFSFDAFRWQKENRVAIDEPFRAKGLHRILYKCPHCLAEGRMQSEGTRLWCAECNRQYELSPYGELIATEGEAAFSHLPDWVAWERAEVRRELEDGRYRLDCDVKIAMLVDTKCLYDVGDGHLLHTAEGFVLTAPDGTELYRQKSTASYSLNVDFYWYEIGDTIGIGTHSALYYCFPKDTAIPVLKARLAAEERYRQILASRKKREK